MGTRSLKPVDVYDIATDIGQEFEAIIDVHGAGTLTNLVPKVIQALEQLERLSVQREQQAATMHDLRATVDKLQAEKADRAAEKAKFEKDLEEFEERTREETQRLVAMVTELQTENRRLHERQHSKNGAPASDADSPSEEDTDVKVLTSLKAVIDRQRQELSAKDALLHARGAELDQYESDLSQLKKQWKEQRRRQRQAAVQQRQTDDERIQLEAELTDARHEMAALRQKLGTAQKENLDLSQSADCSMQNKVVYDRDDPARPRFTFNELRDILNERNELKARLSDVQDELAMYRPGALDTSKSSILCPPGEEPESFSSSELSSPPSLQNELEQQKPSEERDEDLPVHGPLPQDPDDAPWKRASGSESGIKRLFRRLFGSETRFLSPRRPNHSRSFS